MSEKKKMTKDVVPVGFTLKLALVDALPVIFFGIAFILIGILLNSITFIVGASICLISGIIKVLWKVDVVLHKRNTWWMFVQMRIAMPIGFVIMIIGFIISACTKDLSAFWNTFINVPTLICFGLGCVGIIGMVVCFIKLDSSSLKSNWIEQLINGGAQFMFALGTLIALILGGK